MRTRRSPRNQQRLYKAIGVELAGANTGVCGNCGRTVDFDKHDRDTCKPPYVKVEGDRVWDAVKRLGIQHASHYSDLYLPSTPQVHEILRAHGVKINGHSASYFRNQVEGGIWIDLPFAYLPYWESKQR